MARTSPRQNCRGLNTNGASAQESAGNPSVSAAPHNSTSRRLAATAIARYAATLNPSLIAAALYLRGYSVEVHRGDAVAETWIFRAVGYAA